MVQKDRARPFSRKHRRTWIPVTGGMILIGLINLAVGSYLYCNRPKSAPRPAEPPLPSSGDVTPR